MSVNKVILIGNVGKEPEIKVFDSGSKVCNFSLATSETYTTRNGEKATNTEWHNIKCMMPKLVDIIEKYVTKGMQLYVEGKIVTETWNEGENKKYKTVIVINSIQFIGTKKDDNYEPQRAEVVDNEPITDLPF